MRVQVHLLAEHAQFDTEGFFTVIRGGLTGIKATGFPIPLHFAMVTRLWLTPAEAVGPVVVRATLSYNNRGHITVDQPLNVYVDNPDEIFVNSIANFQIVADAPGDLRIDSEVLGHDLPSLLLHVTLV